MALLPSQDHTHSHSDTEDLLIHLRCTSLGCGRKLESPEKTHADMRRMCPLHTEGGPGHKSAFLFLIHIITKHHYSRAYCTLVSSHCPCPWAPGPCCHAAALSAGPETLEHQLAGADKSHSFNLLKMKVFPGKQVDKLRMS